MKDLWNDRKKEDGNARRKKPYIVDGQRVTLEEYRKTKYEDLRVRVPKGRKRRNKSVCCNDRKSLNSFINEAIDEKIEREKK